MALFSFAKKILNMRRHKTESDENVILQDKIHDQHRVLSKTNSLPQNVSLNYSDFSKSQKRNFQENHKPRRKYQSMKAKSENSIQSTEHLFFPVKQENRPRKLSLKKLKNRQLRLQSDINRSLPNVSEETGLVTMSPGHNSLSPMHYRVSQKRRNEDDYSIKHWNRLSQSTQGQDFLPKANQLTYRMSQNRLSTDHHRYRVSQNKVQTQSCDSVDSVDPVTVKLFKRDRQRKPSCDIEFIEISIE